MADTTTAPKRRKRTPLPEVYFGRMWPASFVNWRGVADDDDPDDDDAATPDDVVTGLGFDPADEADAGDAGSDE